MTSSSERNFQNTLTLSSDKEISSELEVAMSQGFNVTLAEAIIKMVIEGKTIQAVARTEGFPPAWKIYEWQMIYPEFKEKLKFARKLRAEYYHDMALDIALETNKKSDVAANKLKVDTVKWAASVGDPASYHPKSSDGDMNVSVTYVIDTGIRRLEENKAVVIERNEIEVKKINSD